MVCLGPMGDLDPTSIIKASNITSDWSQAFRSWPNVTSGWRNWFRRVAGAHRAVWEQYDISLCLDLSLSEMIKNESMLTSASFFWYDLIIQQASIGTQDPPIASQDNLVDSSIPALPHKSPSALAVDEILLKQVRHSLDRPLKPKRNNRLILLFY